MMSVSERDGGLLDGMYCSVKATSVHLAVGTDTQHPDRTFTIDVVGCNTEDVVHSYIITIYRLPVSQTHQEAAVANSPERSRLGVNFVSIQTNRRFTPFNTVFQGGVECLSCLSYYQIVTPLTYAVNPGVFVVEFHHEFLVHRRWDAMDVLPVVGGGEKVIMIATHISAIGINHVERMNTRSAVKFGAQYFPCAAAVGAVGQHTVASSRSGAKPYTSVRMVA